MVIKDVVAGLGEIGRPILELVSKVRNVVGYDIAQHLMNKNKFQKFENVKTSFLHICIPFTNNFVDNVVQLSQQFEIGRAHV